MKIIIKGIPIHYEIMGQGTPLLCIHGWGVDYRILTSCLEPLFKNQEHSFQRIYPDLPGMGQSGTAPWISGSDDLLTIMEDFIDQVIGNEKFLVFSQIQAATAHSARYPHSGWHRCCPAA